MYKYVLIGIFLSLLLSGTGTESDTTYEIENAISTLIIKDINETSHYVENDEFYYVGGDGHKLYLQNNPHAVDISYDELIAFVKSDRTDEILYVDDLFVCADFAEQLHNNAEANGIKAAWVSVDFQGESPGHAFNAFNTTDKGIIYIDSTGFEETSPCSSERILGVEIGKPMWFYKITKCEGYYTPPFVADKVKNINIFW